MRIFLCQEAEYEKAGSFRIWLEKWKQWAVNFPMGKFSETDRDDGRKEKEYKERKRLGRN